MEGSLVMHVFLWQVTGVNQAFFLATYLCSRVDIDLIDKDLVPARHYYFWHHWVLG